MEKSQKTIALKNKTLTFFYTFRLFNKGNI